MVYVAEARALFKYPAATAIAFNVVDDATLIDPVYRVELAVGVDSSTV
jgi:hypothetical protein